VSESIKPVLTFQEDLVTASKLTPQMLVFIVEYVNGASLRDAALRAGYSASAGYRLIKLPEVMEGVVLERARQLKALEVSEARVIQELAKIAFLNARDLFNEDGTVKSIQELSETAGAAIAGIDVEELWEGRGENRAQYGTIKKIKFTDKKGALELLGRYLKLWTDKLEVSGSDDLATKLRKARQNAGKEPKVLEGKDEPDKPSGE
jgi:phage terminase small subunit